MQYQTMNMKIYRSSCSQLFFNIDVLKNRNIHRKTPVLESLFNKVAGLLKRDPTQVFSCKNCQILKYRFFYRTTLLAASGSISLSKTNVSII